MNLVPDASLDSYRVADHKPFPLLPLEGKSRHSFFVCPFFPPSIITRPTDRPTESPTPFLHPSSLPLPVIDLSRIANGQTQSGSCSLLSRSVKVSGSALCSRRSDRERSRRRYITSRISSIPGRLSRNVILTRLFCSWLPLLASDLSSS